MLHTGMGRLGRTAAAGGGSGAGGKVAIKLVHRSKTPVSHLSGVSKHAVEAVWLICRRADDGDPGESALGGNEDHSCAAT